MKKPYNRGNATSPMFVFGLIEVCGGVWVKISLKNLINYFSVSGDSKILISHKKVEV